MSKRIFSIKILIIIFISCALNSCSDDVESNINIPEPPAYHMFDSDVLVLNNSFIDSVSILDETKLKIYSNTSLDEQLKIDKKIAYYNENSADNFFVGKVKQVVKDDMVYIVYTEIPAFDDIFNEIDLSTTINSSNAAYEFTPDSEDNVIFKGIVDNSIWDEIEPVYKERKSSVQTYSKGNEVPIDVTLCFDSESKNFSGSIYLRLEGSVNVSEGGNWDMNVNQVIGLKGSFGIVSASSDRKYIPILQLKNGITLYNYNNLVRLRLKPSFNFFYGGEIKLEAGFNYEVLNSSSHISCVDKQFGYDKLYDNHKDMYFRVKSIHTEGEFGFTLNGNLYAYIFTDEFFSAGISTVAGISVSGEKNVGIQFPDIASFDCSVSLSPILEITPFMAIRMGTLKRIEGSTFKVQTENFSVDLLPNIHDINYRRECNNQANAIAMTNQSDRLFVNAKLENENTSFLETKEKGIALFRCGESVPISYQNFDSSAELIFNIDSTESYEIAKYVKSYNDEIAYGESYQIEDERAVDLGLSVLWSSMNLGAQTPEDYGDYYAYGDLVPTKYSYWKSPKILKLTSEYDAATYKWGNLWRMPTRAELDELLAKCSWSFSGRGYKVTGPNGNSIYLPITDAYHKYYGSSKDIVRGAYRSSEAEINVEDWYIEGTLENPATMVLWLHDDSADLEIWYEYGNIGYPIRPVKEKQK